MSHMTDIILSLSATMLANAPLAPAWSAVHRHRLRVCVGRPFAGDVVLAPLVAVGGVTPQARGSGPSCRLGEQRSFATDGLHASRARRLQCRRAASGSSIRLALPISGILADNGSPGGRGECPSCLRPKALAHVSSVYFDTRHPSSGPALHCSRNGLGSGGVARSGVEARVRPSEEWTGALKPPDRRRECPGRFCRLKAMARFRRVFPIR